MFEIKCTAKYVIIIYAILCNLRLHAEAISPSSTIAIQLAHTAALLNATTQPNMCDTIRVFSISWNPKSTQMAVGVGVETKPQSSTNKGCQRSGVIHILDTTTDTPRLLHSLGAAKDWVRSVAYRPNGSLLAVASMDDKVRIYDAKSSSDPLYTLDETEPVCITYNHKGHQMAVGKSNGGVMFAFGNPPVSFYSSLNYGNAVDSIAYAPNNSELAVGIRDSSVRIYNTDLLDRKLLRTFVDRDNKSPESRVAYSPDSKWLAVGKGDGRLKLYQVQPNNNSKQAKHPTQTLTDTKGSIKSIAFSPDKRKIRLAAGSVDKKLRIYELYDNPDTSLEPFILRASMEDAKGQIQSVTYSTDGNYLAAGDTHGKVYIYSIIDGIPDKTHKVISISAGGDVFVTTEETKARFEIMSSAIYSSSTISNTTLSTTPKTKPTGSSSMVVLSWLALAGVILSQTFNR